MRHPDESHLPEYIGKLLTSQSVTQLAEFLKQEYPKSFSMIETKLRERYKDLARSEKYGRQK